LIEHKILTTICVKKVPIIRVQKEHPAEARISILKAQLLKNKKDLEKAATSLLFDQLLLDRSDIGSKIEDLENDFDLWRAKKCGGKSDRHRIKILGKAFRI
jgi:hypothetical protein